MLQDFNKDEANNATDVKRIMAEAIAQNEDTSVKDDLPKDIMKVTPHVSLKERTGNGHGRFRMRYRILILLLFLLVVGTYVFLETQYRKMCRLYKNMDYYSVAEMNLFGYKDSGEFIQNACNYVSKYNEIYEIINKREYYSEEIERIGREAAALYDNGDYDAGKELWTQGRNYCNMLIFCEEDRFFEAAAWNEDICDTATDIVEAHIWLWRMADGYGDDVITEKNAMDSWITYIVRVADNKGYDISWYCNSVKEVLGQYIAIEDITKGVVFGEGETTEVNIPIGFYYVTNVIMQDGIVNYEILLNDEKVYIPTERIPDSFQYLFKAMREYHSITDAYIEKLEPADDAHDHKWKYDYQLIDGRVIVGDAKNYKNIFLFSQPTADTIADTLERNQNLNEEQKKIILQYAERWLELWPESDLSVLNYNLKDLKINLIDENEMFSVAGRNSTASYSIVKNEIYLLEDGQYDDFLSDDCNVFIHELIHASRTRSIEYTSRSAPSYEISFDVDGFGRYTDEALVTRFAYLIQGTGRRKNNSYTIQTTYYDIICEATGFDGNDYMNHSINYLLEMMDEYMEEDKYAYHIAGLIDMQAMIEYGNWSRLTDSDDFRELYKYITDMYCKMNYGGETSGYDIDAEFTKFWDIMMFDYADGFKSYLTIRNENLFKPYFEANFIE